MADELTRDLIRVQQTLHGYSEGHRLIAGSVKLAQLDARTMLVLSDASGSAARFPVDGYLTGYPLVGSGKYVIARTWPAPEMSRPGCVWTHSLLIDFADLARLSSADTLVEAFAHPRRHGVSTFEGPLELDSSRSATALPRQQVVRSAAWLSAVYGKPRSKIVAAREDEADDQIVLAMWMQQWPRLRRAFRFCTFAGEDRPSAGEALDFQLMDFARAARRPRIVDAVVAGDVDPRGEVDPLVEDLLDPTYGLREFLRDVGGDVTLGRAAMFPLTRLFTALEPGADTASIAEAVRELEDLGPNQGRLGRAAAARLVFSRSDVSDGRLFQFALEQVRGDQALLNIDPMVVGRAMLKWAPEMLAEPASFDGPLRAAVDAVIPDMDAGDLAQALAGHLDSLVAVLPARPDLLAVPAVWASRSHAVTAMLGSVDLDEVMKVNVVSAMMAAGRDDCADIAAKRFGIGAVVRALEKTLGDRIAKASPWLRAVADARPNELASRLADGTIQDRRIMIGLAQLVDPDGVPNDVGQDPWVTAAGRAAPSSDGGGEDMLAAFLFYRAMGWRSGSRGRLFFLSVQRLHEALAAGRLPGEVQKFVERRLPGTSFSRDWDRCERLRKAVVDQFIDRDLPPAEFGTVVDSGALWRKLVDIAADSYRGRRYLDRVRAALREGPDDWWHDRARDVDRKIK